MVKKIYFCQNCGYETYKWMGRCPACESWNTFVEEKILPRGKAVFGEVEPVGISKILTGETDRFSTGFGELDRVLGGGIVTGSLILLGGDPGIGKSTLLLQLAGKVGQKQKVLYVSGEESPAQIKLRAERLNISGEIDLLTHTNVAEIEEVAVKGGYELIIVDSIQTMYLPELGSAPGTVTQVRESAGRFMRLSKEKNKTIFLIGHVTKDGYLAGPRVMEHMVDVVLYLEGERHNTFRLLRSVKNRFGSTNELGIFEMVGEGLKEVSNPSEFFISLDRKHDCIGSAVVVSLEGSRPFLVEVQALVAPTGFGTPRRVATGFDYNRFVLLLAVLEKKLGFRMSVHDAYLNVVGGLKISEPAADLGVLLAVVSSFREEPLPNDGVFLGEIGLTGEIRPVLGVDKRLKEAERLGFKKAFLPKQSINFKTEMEITTFTNLQEAIFKLFSI
ncbi:DNA repair protein RadA [Carboxydothermus islandicus]|nr:DNA repair protein RadA [Carboxydothermus islandicus]